MTASFFILRDFGKRFTSLKWRVESLEDDRLLEAYRREGYDVD